MRTHVGAEQGVDYLPLRFGARCDSALAAAGLLALDVRPSLRTLEAAFAAFVPVRLCLAIFDLSFLGDPPEPRSLFVA